MSKQTAMGAKLEEQLWKKINKERPRTLQMGGYLWAELYREVGRGHSRRQKHHEKTQGNDTMWHVQTIARSLLKWENTKQERKLEEQGAQWSRASEDILKSLNLGYGQWGALCEEESMLDLWSRVGVQFAVWRTEWMVAKPKARRQIRIKWENNRELYGGTPPTLFWRGYIGRNGKQAEKSICSTALLPKIEFSPLFEALNMS